MAEIHQTNSLLTVSNVLGEQIVEEIRRRAGPGAIDEVNQGAVAGRERDALGPDLGAFVDPVTGVDLNSAVVLEHTALGMGYGHLGPAAAQSDVDLLVFVQDADGTVQADLDSNVVPHLKRNAAGGPIHEGFRKLFTLAD